MKKVICLLLLCLLPFILLAHENNGQVFSMTNDENMPLEQVKAAIVTFYNHKKGERELIKLMPLLTFINSDLFIAVWEFYEKNNKVIETSCFLLDSEKRVSKYFFLGYMQISEYLQLYYQSGAVIFEQLRKFRICEFFGFIYDFNHDGINKLLEFEEAGNGNDYYIIYVDPIKQEEKIILSLDVDYFSWSKQTIEFINYKVRQGIKFYNKDKWQFYYYDRVQQKYVRDETASSEELEQIHGSPDFFAEAGIDYTKLERPLIPADLEGFSKPALRIWRNAVYARHGRTFKSEDLQALFNEYAWYKADKNYTDAKLTDTDKANIKLISEFEKK